VKAQRSSKPFLEILPFPFTGFTFSYRMITAWKFSLGQSNQVFSCSLSDKQA